MTNVQFFRGAIDSTGCITNAWNMLKLNYWLYFGATLIVVAVYYCVPCINIFILGPLSAGIYYTALKDMRGEPIEFSMMFKGFEKFGPLLVVGIIQAIPAIISQMFQFTFRISDIALHGMTTQSGENDPNIFLAGGFLTAVIVFSILIFIFSIVWAISFSFAVPIVMENEIGVGDALKLSFRAGWSNAGGIIVLSILLGLLCLLGFVAICIGILFVLPLVYVAWAFAYRQIFPAPDASQFHSLPPPPETYQGSFGQGM